MIDRDIEIEYYFSFLVYQAYPLISVHRSKKKIVFMENWRIIDKSWDCFHQSRVSKISKMFKLREAAKKVPPLMARPLSPLELISLYNFWTKRAI